LKNDIKNNSKNDQMKNLDEVYWGWDGRT
jgi:hypothetical protein